MAKSSFLGRWTSRLFAKQAVADGKFYCLKDGDLVIAPFSQEKSVTGQTIASGALITVQHDFNAIPKLVQVILTCITADGVFAVGDIVEPGLFWDANLRNNTITHTLNQTRLRLSNDGTCFMVGNPNTGAPSVVLTNARWTLTLKVTY